MNDFFINRIELKKEKLKDIDMTKYPFSIKCIQNMDSINITKPVSFFYGENGIGKSTLIEAIAIAMGMNPEGGSDNMTFSTFDDCSKLFEYLRLSKFGLPKSKFFLRAESFYNVASSISNDKGEGGLRPLSDSYGGDPHECSHGESFLKTVENRFWPNGLYILDEPEAALSPTRQLTLLCHINKLVGEGCQFIIATHSPIFLAYQNATIFDLNNGLKVIDYKDTEIYNIYKGFLENPYKIQKELFESEVENNSND